ncbi:MAG: hypothetical protein PHE73_07640 [Sulfurovaceae bacterium]|nr:hypothetical protein [Sulfurovaceae bacterium]
MSIGEIFYIIALVLFVGITFVIIRNFYSNKFNPNGNGLEDLDNDNSSN